MSLVVSFISWESSERKEASVVLVAGALFSVLLWRQPANHKKLLSGCERQKRTGRRSRCQEKTKQNKGLHKVSRWTETLFMFPSPSAWEWCGPLSFHSTLPSEPHMACLGREPDLRIGSTTLPPIKGTSSPLPNFTSNTQWGHWIIMTCLPSTYQYLHNRRSPTNHTCLIYKILCYFYTQNRNVAPHINRNMFYN